MCGIAGIVTKQPRSIQEQLLQAEAIQLHRGPDGQGTGVYRLGEWTVGFAHQRLSILDRSELGAQPFVHRQEKGVLIYNGEVYNYREIRGELKGKGYSFASDSDTEVVLTALHHWGIDGALTRFNGMWAFAWLDLESRKLHLSRDRFGVKPLYYADVDGQLLFASEIKTIHKLANRIFSLNLATISAYIQQSLLGASEDTFFQGIHKVPPRHTLSLDLTSSSLDMKQHPYWQFPQLQMKEAESEKQLIDQARELFTDAVRLRLRSDVPVGLLLSGGLDSSSIAAVMNTFTKDEDNLHILSAVSNDARFDESPHIDRMSRHLQRPVHKVLLHFEAKQAFDYLHSVTFYHDEPIGSFSTVAHYLLMQQARELGITVILSGQGADELLCGYRKYLGFYLQSLLYLGKYREAQQVLVDFWRQGTILRQFSYSEAKRYLPSFFKEKEADIRGEALRSCQPFQLGLGKGMTVQERQLLDITRFSVPALTHYEDRMSMAWSREVRLPFLDYRLIEKILPLAPRYKLYNGWSKYLLRKAMEPLLPPEIAWRKDKQGFVNPESEWLKHELRDEVLRYFSPDSLIFAHGLIHRENLLAKYERYCRQPAGKGAIWFKDIFNPLALEIWLRQFYG